MPSSFIKLCKRQCSWVESSIAGHWEIHWSSETNCSACSHQALREFDETLVIATYTPRRSMYQLFHAILLYRENFDLALFHKLIQPCLVPGGSQANWCRPISRPCSRKFSTALLFRSMMIPVESQMVIAPGKSFTHACLQLPLIYQVPALVCFSLGVCALVAWLLCCSRSPTAPLSSL